ncbi:MAG TPA: HAMP domain-containing sensor histidine kinase, partial [Myxococcota bacterium]|nr:HAMP domain-containing sensor histidine kinase [Myxococcota bacterium]
SHAASFQIIFVFVSIKLILCYYLGFTPPLWLWRAWQQNELHRFLIAAQSGQPRGESGRLERLLVDAAVRSVAGLNGMLILEDLSGNRRILGMETDLQVLPLQPDEGSILEARRLGRALLVTEVDGQLSPSELALTREQGARSMVVVPVAAGHLRWGALLVFLPRGTLFPDSDLNLLQLLVDQYLNLAKADAAFEEQRRLIAQLRQANEEVVRASRHKSEFMANMSHELRTPLNAIIGFTQLQLDGTLGPPAPAHEELLQDVLSSSIHLLRMISDILDLAKVEAGKMSFAPQDVRAEAVLEDVVKTLRPLAEEKGLKLITQFEPLGPLYLDPLRLRQILLNYLSNAIKFTETGEVIVRLGPEGEDHFRLDVIDRGIGVAAEDIGRLFLEFE